MLRTRVLVALVLVASSWAWAQVNPTYYQVSPDVPATVGTVAALDADVAELDVATSVWSVPPSVGLLLPPGVGVDAVHCYAAGDVVFSTDAAFTWTGGSAADEDLVLYSGGGLTLLFDGSAAGIPQGVDLDAVAVSSVSPLDILFSVDADATLGPVTATDDDIVAYTGAGGFAVWLAGSGWLGGEQARAGVDGLAVAGSTGFAYVSLDASASLAGGVTVTDDDLIVLSGGAVTGAVALTGFPTTGTDVDGLDIQLAPTVGNPTLDSAIVNTATAVTWAVEYLDHDNDPPIAGSPSLSVDGGGGVAMSQSSGCGAPLCNNDFADGERYEHTGVVGYGASHGYAITAGDGKDTTSPATGPGPSYVSTPADADGDTDHDAVDLAVILLENHDANGGADLDLVRGGSYGTSWGGTDADSDHQVGTADLPAAVGVIF